MFFSVINKNSTEKSQLKTNIDEEGEYLKRGAQTVCRFSGGTLARKREVFFFEWGIDTPANAHYDLIAITTVYLRKLKWPHFINIFITKISACHIKIFCNKERKHRLFVNTDYWVMSTKIRKYLKKTALYVSLFRKENIT